MSTNTIQIADALVVALNGGSYSKQFVAKRNVLPLFEIKDLNTLQVTVIPRSVDASILTRECLSYDHTIDVAIQKKLNKPIEVEFDSLIAFAFELTEAVRHFSISGVLFLGVAIQPLYSLDDLAQDGIFTSVLQVKYKTAS